MQNSSSGPGLPGSKPSESLLGNFPCWPEHPQNQELLFFKKGPWGVWSWGVIWIGDTSTGSSRVEDLVPTTGLGFNRF